MLPDLARALDLLGKRLYREAGWPLLARWRRTRDPALAGALDRLVLLQGASGQLPTRAREWFDRECLDYSWCRSHPFEDAEPPDPRSTRPLLLGHARQLRYGHRRPGEPRALLARLRAHGDPRAARWLAEVYFGRPLPADVAEVAQALPQPTPLAPDEAAAVAAVAAAIEALDPDNAHWRTDYRREREMEQTAIVVPERLGAAAFAIDAPGLREGRLWRCVVEAQPGALACARAHAHLLDVAELSFISDSRWDLPERPSWWVDREWTGAHARAEAVALLDRLSTGRLRAVATLPGPLITELGAAGVQASWNDVSVQLAGSIDFLSLFTDLASLIDDRGVTLRLAGGPLAAADVLPSLAASGVLRKLALLCVTTRDWTGWILADVPVVRLQGSKTWTLEITHTPSGQRLGASLPSGWEIFDGEFEDPPTPGADLIEWLEAIPDGWFTEIDLHTLGELDDPSQLLAAARRQRRLTALRVDDDGSLRDVGARP